MTATVRVLSEVDEVLADFEHSDAECDSVHRDAGYFALVDAVLALDQHISAVYDLRSDAQPDWLDGAGR